MKTPAFAALMAALALPALAQDYPHEVTHKFGTIDIPAKPERVASLDYGGIDNLLALGVQPVAVRWWYGDEYPLTAWPWAQAHLTGTPEVLKGDLNFEQIATTKPDAIIGINSGITAEEYAQLSKIAPVLAVPKGYADYGMAWDEKVRRTAAVIGETQEAERQIKAIKDRLAQVKADHPDWQGKTVSVAFHYDGKPGVYTTVDPRSRLMAELGFVVPPVIDEIAGDGAFYVSLSPEDMSPMDTDLVIWFGFGDDFSKILNMPARPFLTAAKEGHEAYAGQQLAGAFSHASLLSLTYVIDRLVPMIEAAMDDDPATNADDLTR